MDRVVMLSVTSGSAVGTASWSLRRGPPSMPRPLVASSRRLRICSTHLEFVEFFFCLLLFVAVVGVGVGVGTVALLLLHVFLFRLRAVVVVAFVVVVVVVGGVVV